MSKSEIKDSLEFRKYGPTLTALIILGGCIVFVEFSMFLFIILSFPKEYSTILSISYAFLQLPFIIIYLIYLITILKKRSKLIKTSENYICLEGTIKKRNELMFGKSRYEISFTYENEKRVMASGEFKENFDNEKLLVGYDKINDKMIIINVL